MRTVGVLLCSLLTGAALAGEPPIAPCAEQLPRMLTVGVPRISSATAQRGAAEVVRILRTLPTAPTDDPCFLQRPLQLDLAIGSDYQLLDWLNQGLVDAAIVPDLTLWLLEHDELRVYEFPPSIDGMSTLLPARRASPVARRFARADDAWQRAAQPAEQEFDAFLEEVLSAANGGQARITHELVLASHLSSTGFLAPIRRAAEKFHRATDDVKTRDAAWTHFMAATRFAIDCDTVDACFAASIEGDRGAIDDHALPDGTTLILFPAEETLRNEPAAGSGPDYRSHLVITASAALRVFGLREPNLATDPRAVIVEPPSTMPEEIDALVKNPPTVLRDTFRPEPLFGTRTYAFTVSEVIRLLRQQRRGTTDHPLALVLPGGGVKAAYQTQILDELYKHGYLHNERAAGSGDGSALPVHAVIGTSGGALLGYFVAQLEEKPIPLFDILWKRGNAYLTSTDVFGWTDLLRYVSIVASYGLFCLLLFFHATGQARAAGTKIFRWRLALATMPLFVLAPVLIRAASEPSAEHVPDIEGIFYSIMVILVMVVDQALVWDPAAAPPAPTTRARLRRYERAALAGGMALLGIALLAKFHLGKVNFAVAFTTMSLLLLGGTIAVAISKGRFKRPLRRAIEIALAILAVLLLCSFGIVIPMPHILAGLALILLGALQYWYAKTARTGLQWLITVAAVFLIAELCWPPPDPEVGAWAIRPFSLGFLQSESMSITTAAFFLSLGLIVLVVAGALWTFRNDAFTRAAHNGAARGAYVIDRPRELETAMVVLIGYSFVTLLSMMVLTAVLPNVVTPLELTGPFWKALAVVSILIGWAVIVASKLGRFARTPFAKALPYLTSEHPNGTIVQGRYLRMLLLAVSGVVWWNIVEAPALYGNRTAQTYHASAIQHFNDARCRECPADDRFRPTTRFVTPANNLKQNGTRYFLFMARGEVGCADVPKRDASNAQWTVYRSDAGPQGRDDRCQSRPGDTFVSDVAFASGSPFPIFPAHGLVEMGADPNDPSKETTEEYVDGGYSNNIPVDAARTLHARQVLIIDSSSPLPPNPKPDGLIGVVREKVLGKLITNAKRLPGYLFYHAQQVDRLSRRDMFVVSLSPSRDEPDWPPLFDFRSDTVRRMEATAHADMARRIGIVQSWGPPSFTVHVELPGVVPRAPEASRGGHE